MVAMSGRQRDGFSRRTVEARASSEYKVEEVIDSVTEDIVDRMLELGMTRKDLADRLDVSPARITRLLRGLNNFTVKTLVDVSRALECDLSVALVPHQAGSSATYRLSPDLSRSERVAESLAGYGASARGSGYSSRDAEIRAHLASGKLRVEGGHVYMRRESDGSYQPSKFRRAGTHSTMEKTNVGRRAYYRHRIIAVADELSGRD